MRRLLSFTAAAAALLLSTVAPSFADRYDTPTITVVDASKISITLAVTAGASGLPAGFSIDWMSQLDFDAEGGWPAAGGGMYYCEFSGVPTCNVWPGALSYAIGPFETAWIEVGDLFDETGVVTDYNVELEPSMRYVFRAYAEGDANGEDSYYTGTKAGNTMDGGSGGDCIKSHGYWKNHASAWPVQTLTLGTVSYTKAQLLQMLSQPSNGNGLVILVHQLIATKLNILAGGDPGPVATQVANADAMIGNKVPPPVGAGFLSPSSVNATKDVLDNYNNGRTPAQCGFTQSDEQTWGSVKLRYRD